MKYIFAILLFALASCDQTKEENDPAKVENISTSLNGEFLFKNNCASCHKADRDFTGPALYDASSRWPDKNLMYEFVRNPAEVMKKSAYVKKLFKKYSPTVMMPFPDMTNEKIDAILNYCVACNIRYQHGIP